MRKGGVEKGWHDSQALEISSIILRALLSDSAGRVRLMRSKSFPGEGCRN